MIYIEQQEQYQNQPLYGVLDFKYTNENDNPKPNPFDVVGGLIDKTKDVYEKGRVLVETIKGGEVSTNIGGYDITVSENKDEPKKPFYKKPVFIGTAVLVVLVSGYLIYQKFNKNN